MRRSNALDEKDREILALLEEDGRRPNSEIARATGLSAPTVAERIARLQDRGIIRRFTVEYGYESLGFSVGAIVEFEPRSNSDAAGIEFVAGHPSVRACYKVTGPSMLVLVIRVSDSSELHNLLLDFSKYGQTKTSLILSSELERPSLMAPRERSAVEALLERSRKASGPSTFAR